MSKTITTLEEENCGHRRFGGTCTECAWKKFNSDPMRVVSPSPYKSTIDDYNDSQEAFRRFCETGRI
jgi:hypothetical protein